MFGGVGVIDASGGETNPVSIGGGVGYRMRVGSNLTFRLDGRFTHLTEDRGNSIGFALSIGGLFGR